MSTTTNKPTNTLSITGSSTGNIFDDTPGAAVETLTVSESKTDTTSGDHLVFSVTGSGASAAYANDFQVVASGSSYILELIPGYSLPASAPATLDLNITVTDETSAATGNKPVAGYSTSAPLAVVVNTSVPTITVNQPVTTVTVNSDYLFIDPSLPANTFTDPEGNSHLTYAATLSSGAALPSWLLFCSPSETLAGLPLYSGFSIGKLNILPAVADGTYGIKVTATDSVTHLSASTTVNLTVAADPIETNAIPNVVVNEGTAVNDVITTGFELVPGYSSSLLTTLNSLSPTFYALAKEVLTSFTPINGNAAFLNTDILTASSTHEGLALSATITGNSGQPTNWLTFNATTDTISGTPNSYLDMGTYTITMTAKNNQGATAVDQFTITVNEFMPTASAVNFGSVVDGNHSTLTEVITLNGDTIPAGNISISGPNAANFALGAITSNATAGTESVVVTFTPTNMGAETANLVVVDKYGLIADVSLSGTAGNPLSVVQTANQSFYSGSSDSLQILATDSPNSILNYAVTGGSLPSNLTLTAGTGLISGVLSPNTTLTNDIITITVTDGLHNTATDTFTLNVADPLSAPTNPVPETVFSGGSVNLVSANTFMEAIPTLEGPLSYSDTTLPAGITLNAGGTLSVAPNTLTGSYSVMLTATDQLQNTGTETFTLNVTDPLSLIHQTISLPLFSGASENLNVAQAFRELDNGANPLTFTITDNGVAGAVPSGLTFTNGVLSGTTPTNTTETDTIVVTATDTHGNTATDLFTLTTTDPLSLGHQTASVSLFSGASENLNVAQAFREVDNSANPVTFTITDTDVNGVQKILPTGLTFVNGVLSGTAPTNTTETDNIAVTATDSLGNTATDPFTLTITNPLSVNPNAITTLTGAQEGIIDLNQAHAFVEAANSPLFYSATLVDGSPLPTGISLNAQGMLNVGNVPNQTDTIIVTATDALGNTATDSFTINVGPLFYYTNVAGGFFSGLATDNLSNVYAWGSNSNPAFGNIEGNLGIATLEASSVPLEIQGAPPIVDIGSGEGNSFGLETTGQVYGWGAVAALGVGSNYYYSLNSLNEGSTLPTIYTTPAPVLDYITLNNSATQVITTPLTNIVQLGQEGGTSGSYYAIDSSGHLWVWGEENLVTTNSQTNFNNGVAAEVIAGAQNVIESTTTLLLSNIVDVSSDSGQTAFAVDTSGHVYAWGNNYGSGALGLGLVGDFTSIKVPAAVVAGAQNQLNPMAPLSNIITVDSHSAGGVALDNGGHVWAWGDNSDDALGDGQTSQNQAYSDAPVEVVAGAQNPLNPMVAPLSNIVSIAAGCGDTAYALDSQGHVWAWGDNGFGELGNGTDNSATPVEVLAGSNTTAPLSNIIAITSDGVGAYALDSSGHIWAWGDNTFGELGNGATLPTTLILLTDVLNDKGGFMPAEIVGNVVSTGINLVNLTAEANSVGLPGASYAGAPALNEILDFTNPAQDYLVLRVTNGVVENLASATLAANPSDLPTNANLLTTAELDGISTFSQDNNGTLTPANPTGLETHIQFTGGGEITLEGVSYTSFENFANGHLIFSHAG